MLYVLMLGIFPCRLMPCHAVPCHAVRTCVLQSQSWHMGDKGSDVTVKLLSVSGMLAHTTWVCCSKSSAICPQHSVTV
jgi:hypothetical protein